MICFTYILFQISGFRRDIPGYARYSMLGDESAGEFGLMISDVRLTDDAEFQCQVGPKNGEPSLQASAHLTVQGNHGL